MILRTAFLPCLWSSNGMFDDGDRTNQTNLLQGTLDMMILKALAVAEMHGLAISRRIEQITQGTFQVKPGSLFPALHRMQEEGWLVSAWGDSENKRRAKYYKLTPAGRRQLESETKRWGRISLAIARALAAFLEGFPMALLTRLSSLARNLSRKQRAEREL